MQIHVGKQNTERLRKIWLEPNVELADKGDLTNAQTKEVVEIAKKYRNRLLKQWHTFKKGDAIRIIKIRKTR